MTQAEKISRRHNTPSAPNRIYDPFRNQLHLEPAFRGCCGALGGGRFRIAAAAGFGQMAASAVAGVGGAAIGLEPTSVAVPIAWITPEHGF